MTLLTNYDSIFDLFKNATKPSYYSSKVNKRFDYITSNLHSNFNNSKNNKYKNNSLNSNYNFISPYNNFLKNYL